MTEWTLPWEHKDCLVLINWHWRRCMTKSTHTYSGHGEHVPAATWLSLSTTVTRSTEVTFYAYLCNHSKQIRIWKITLSHLPNVEHFGIRQRKREREPHCKFIKLGKASYHLIIIYWTSYVFNDPWTALTLTKNICARCCPTNLSLCLFISCLVVVLCPVFQELPRNRQD